MPNSNRILVSKLNQGSTKVQHACLLAILLSLDRPEILVHQSPIAVQCTLHHCPSRCSSSSVTVAAQGDSTTPQTPDLCATLPKQPAARTPYAVQPSRCCGGATKSREQAVSNASVATLRYLWAPQCDNGESGANKISHPVRRAAPQVHHMHPLRATMQLPPGTAGESKLPSHSVVDLTRLVDSITRRAEPSTHIPGRTYPNPRSPNTPALGPRRCQSQPHGVAH